MNDLDYTPLSDGFKIAKDDNGNIVFARNDTTLFVAAPGELQIALTPFIGSVGAAGQAVVDTTSADALAAANANIASLTEQLGVANDKIVELTAQISADKAAAEAITKAVAQAQTPPADAAPSSTEPPAAIVPTIAPSNTGITGS